MLFSYRSIWRCANWLPSEHRSLTGREGSSDGGMEGGMETEKDRKIKRDRVGYKDRL